MLIDVFDSGDLLIVYANKKVSFFDFQADFNRALRAWLLVSKSRENPE
jgi:hypothetical protein